MRLNPFRASRGRASAVPAGWLKPATKKAISGTLLLVFSVITGLSFLHLAGPTGTLLLVGLRKLLGWMAYVLPLITILLGLELLRPSLVPIARSRWVGIGLLLIGLLGSGHLLAASLPDALQAAAEGRGGGYLGFMLTYPLSTLLSPIASGVLFVAALLIGIMLTFNLSLHDIWRGLRLKAAGTTEEVGEDTGGADIPRFHVNTMATNVAKPDVVQVRLQQQEEEQQKAKARQIFRSANRAYKPPSLDLLHSSIGRPDSGNIKENAAKIKRTLENFGIAVSMGEVNVGPTVTQYTLRPEEGIKLSRITALQNDLALALAAHPIRIEAPIPKKNLVGIEIPNKEVSLVRLRDLLSSKEFRRSESPLTIALGKDVAGVTVGTTLERMPHLLLAGATGSGKSVCINTLLLALLYRNSPAVMRLILVDPKRVELNIYDGIPHLLTPVIIDSAKTINALKWAVKEMDRRYRLLSESRARNLLSYNTSHPDDTIPFIVIVIDELADLMAKHGRDVEAAIVRLSQMARAVGVHLVLATQRPSVNVITGLIKANIPSRIAFHVASQIDSRTILDMAGAEKLLGNGDMLYLSSEMAKPRRLQGAFISEEEVQRVVEAIKANTEEPSYDDSIVAPGRDASGLIGEGGFDDDLFEEAKRVVMQAGKASASLLQRRLRVGYARAARLLDMLQEQNIIGSGEGNKPREVLVRVELEADVRGESMIREDTLPVAIPESEEESSATDEW